MGERKKNGGKGMKECKKEGNGENLKKEERCIIWVYVYE
jgi:hypothetical protein